MRNDYYPRLPGWAVLLIAAAALVLGGTVQLVVDDDSGRGTTTVHKDPTPTPAEKQLPVVPRVTPPAPGAPATAFDSDKAAGGLPPSAEPPPALEDRQADQVDDGTYDTSGVLKGAAAQPAHKRCYTPRNGGARSLRSIGLMVAHVTVSLNVTGTRDGDALCGFFRRVKASPTWTVDNEGNSWENVPLGRVPWTQAYYNRVSCSIEYVGSTGRRGEGPAQWTDRQLQEGGRLFAGCAKRAGIPIRSGRVSSGGSVLRTGLITHLELGLKGGGHTDPGDYWLRARQLYWIKFYAGGGVTSTDRTTCRKLEWWRRHGRPHGQAERNATRRRRALAARRVTCTRHGPVRR